MKTRDYDHLGLTPFTIKIKGVNWLPDLFAILCERIEWIFPQLADSDIAGLTEVNYAEVELVLKGKGEIDERLWDNLWWRTGNQKKRPATKLPIHPCDAYNFLRTVDYAFNGFNRKSSDPSSDYFPFWKELNDPNGEKNGSSLTTQPLKYGWLLPCESRQPGRGQFLGERFFHLRWIRPTPGLTVSYHCLAERDDLDSWRHENADFKVGFLPCIERQDVRFESLSQRGKPAYDTVHRDEEKIAERICRVIDANSTRIDLLVAPELACSPAIWEQVQKHLRTRPLLPRAANRLKVIMLGTAAHEQRNRALVVDYRGNELFSQDKMHRYEMSANEMKRYQISDLDRQLGGHEENAFIHPRCLKLCDSEVLGRFAVLICEDFAHLEPAAVTAIKLGVQLVICPVMDGDFQPYRWVASWADWYARVYNVQTISVNSLVMPPHHIPENDDFGIGLIGQIVDENDIPRVEILRTDPNNVENPVISSVKLVKNLMIG